MKKYIALLTVAAFALVANAGDNKACTDKAKAACSDKDKVACSEKDKAACADKAKAACPSSAAAASCCPGSKAAKQNANKLTLKSPKAAGEAGR